jgi:GNAT superfamily N-acetyltransferase
MGPLAVRAARPEDAAGIAQISRENGSYYARLASEYFKEPDPDGLVELIRDDSAWREAPGNLALVAEIDGEIAGYLEASLQEPLATARWQAQRDLGEMRLFINFVGTSDARKRQGVATHLVRAAEQWGCDHGAVAAICTTYIDSPLSVPFWEERMSYTRRSVIFRKPLQPSGSPAEAPAGTATRASRGRAG